jgi:hypothetical protein
VREGERERERERARARAWAYFIRAFARMSDTENSRPSSAEIRATCPRDGEYRECPASVAPVARRR